MSLVLPRPLLNLILKILPTSHWFPLKRRLLRLSGIRVGDGSKVNGGVRVLGRGSVSIGRETWVGPGVVFYSHPDAPITIGDRCDLAPEVCLMTGSHDIGSHERRAGTGWAKPIVIANGCWVGARAMILGGVTIGEGTVIAAGAVVTSAVPPGCLAGGVPAKLIRSLEDSSSAKDRDNLSL